MNINFKDYLFPKSTVRYLFDQDSGAVSLVLFPKYYESDNIHNRRSWLQVPELVQIGKDMKAWHVGSLAHLALRHHVQGNGAGNTLKYGMSTYQLKFESQNLMENGDIQTIMAAQEGYEIIHILHLCEGANAFEIKTIFVNGTSKDVIVDMITSFSLDNLSPYDVEDAKSLSLHRFRGGWSLEGRHIVDSIEELNFASPWTYAFPESERYGVLGSHPVKRFFPVSVVEDTCEGVFWGASLAVAASWQMELSRDSDCYSLSGGIADCEFGSWQKIVKSGSVFEAPKAYISTALSLDDVCDNLTDVYQFYVEQQPKTEQSLPIIFNEWCTTWGNPSHDRMLKLADVLQGTPVRYMVIDAGWTKIIPNSFGQGGNGDWEYDESRFPDGILGTSLELQKRGFYTGIWFEFEVTTKGAKVYGKDWDHMHLQRSNEIIASGEDRSFWDFRNPEVIAYLKEKVIKFIVDNQIGYLKVDYNGSIGIGCDGAESVGSGLHEHINAVMEFFLFIKKDVPNLVIENCASGGHRLVSPFFEMTAMSSYSDAHEGKEVPVIAARLHRLGLPRQLQIWAVLKKEHDINTLLYRLAAGFLGRLCISGDIDKLSNEQLQIMYQSFELYECCKDIIKYGYTRIQGMEQINLRHLYGWQAAIRYQKDERRALIVLHGFENCPENVNVNLLKGKWNVKELLCEGTDIFAEDNCIKVQGLVSFTACVIVLERE